MPRKQGASLERVGRILPSRAMSAPLLQIDAFADRVFSGNPAGVCLLHGPEHAALREADDWMLALAGEMNLSETAFVWPDEDAEPGTYRLRWFTPGAEVDLCGHATLATAHAIWHEACLEPASRPLTFITRSGPLVVTAGEARNDAGDRSAAPISMDFPAALPESCPVGEGVLDALGLERSDVVWAGSAPHKLLLHLDWVETLLRVAPSFDVLGKATERGVIITCEAPETPRGRIPACDFVSRMFAPAWRVNEDPVTGSAHCILAPFWTRRLGRNELVGFQASERGGIVRTTMAGDRVTLTGTARTVFRGTLDERALG